MVLSWCVWDVGSYGFLVFSVYWIGGGKVKMFKDVE